MEKIRIIFLAILLGGCQKYYISIAQDKIDRDYLASSGAKTPDFRQENPPKGDRLIVEWKVPQELLKKNPSLFLDIIYKNYTQDTVVYPIRYRMDYGVYTLLGEEYVNKKGILTYSAQIRTGDGEIFREWNHQLWTELITDEESSESANSTSSSVIDQSIQGSVTETEDFTYGQKGD